VEVDAASRYKTLQQNHPCMPQKRPIRFTRSVPHSSVDYGTVPHASCVPADEVDGNGAHSLKREVKGAEPIHPFRNRQPSGRLLR
jgi:hypothetical protein